MLSFFSKFFGKKIFTSSETKINREGLQDCLCKKTSLSILFMNLGVWAENWSHLILPFIWVGFRIFLNPLHEFSAANGRASHLIPTFYSFITVLLLHVQHSFIPENFSLSPSGTLVWSPPFWTIAYIVGAQRDNIKKSSFQIQQGTSLSIQVLR